MDLAGFWAAVLALSLLLYVVLDGFDLGVGIPVRLHARRGDASPDAGRHLPGLGR